MPCQSAAGGVLDQDLAGGQGGRVDPGPGVRGGDGDGVDGELESGRQVGVEDLHGAHDLGDLPGRGAGGVAHGGRRGEADDAAVCAFGLRCIVPQVGAEGVRAEAVRHAPVAHRGGAVRGRGREGGPRGRRHGADAQLAAYLDGGREAGIGRPGEFGDGGDGALAAARGGGGTAAPAPAGGEGGEGGGCGEAGKDGNRCTDFSVHGALHTERFAFAPAGAGPFAIIPKGLVRPRLFAQARGATPCQVGLLYSSRRPDLAGAFENDCKMMVAVRAIPVKQLGMGVMRPPGGARRNPPGGLGTFRRGFHNRPQAPSVR